MRLRSGIVLKTCITIIPSVNCSLVWLRRMPHRNSLHFKARIKEQLARTQKSARGVLAVKVRPVDGVETLEKADVGAENLHGDQIIHREPSGFHSPLECIHHQTCFFFRRGARPPGFRVQTKVAAKIERVPGLHSITERQVGANGALRADALVPTTGQRQDWEKSSQDRQVSIHFG